MKRRLYVINSPSYVETHSSHTCGQQLTTDILSEHFTYLYYNLIKFGLIDEVVIFPRKGPHDKFRSEIPSSINFEQGRIILNWETEKMIDIINSDPESFVYCWGNYEDCKKLNKSFVMFNPVVAGSNKSLDRKFHHHALIEGMSHETKFRLVPSGIPISICPLTSKQFTEIDVNSFQKTKKTYDWVMVSSFDPRKRHLEFLNSISRLPQYSSLRGCIVARNPDNKGRINDGHYVYDQIKKKDFSKNIDIFLNITNESKMDILSRSKVFVCTSTYDFGPRASIEALQAGVPVYSTPHMGACDWIESGRNGEIVEDPFKSPETFYRMLNKYDNGEYLSYSKTISEKLKPESIYPDLVKRIQGYRDEFLFQ